MEYKSLYRKWRPKTFADVSGQEHITRVLESQVINKKVSHAYLFTGSRGTGKTTCAKILAKAVNCERPEGGSPCNSCATCAGIESGGIIDVVEIDAASNNGVDDVRELREEVAFTPSGALKKVYIVDEVHMMSTAAFNALLKTLEEPPPHIIFILATTELNKIPATILSRCQRHDFRRLTPEIIAGRVSAVCAGEGIEIEERAVKLIARLANGAMRDALSLLEVVRGDAGQAVTEDYVAEIAGACDSGKIISICGHIKDKDAAAALLIFWEMYEASLDCASFCAALLEVFRDIQVAKIMREPGQHISADGADKIIEIAQGFSSAELMRCYARVSEVFAGLGRYTANRRVAVEMMLCEMCIAAASTQDGKAPAAARPQVSGSFGAYADMVEEIAKENKIVPQYLRGAACELEGTKLTIITDSEFKAGILRSELALIKRHAAAFVGGECEVAVELAGKPDDAAAGASIDDIEVWG